MPGEPGLWILLFGDMLLFTVLFAVYLHQRSKDPDLFARAQETLNRTLGAANTLVLLTSSILVVIATHAMRRHLNQLASRITIGALLIGSLFVLIKVFEYYEKIANGVTPNTNQFFMYYWTLTGLHLLHVIIGLGILGALSVLARKPQPSRTHIIFFECGACFWHVVDLLWIMIFPLIFLVR